MKLHICDPFLKINAFSSNEWACGCQPYPLSFNKGPTTKIIHHICSCKCQVERDFGQDALYDGNNPGEAFLIM